MAPRTIVTPGAGQTSVSVALPQGLGFKVQTVYAVIDTTGGATTPELTLADASGQVIATKPQATKLSGSTTETATWALRLGDEGAATGGGGGSGGGGALVAGSVFNDANIRYGTGFTVTEAGGGGSGSGTFTVTFTTALPVIPVVELTANNDNPPGGGPPEAYFVEQIGTPTVNGFTVQTYKQDGTTGEGGFDFACFSPGPGAVGVGERELLDSAPATIGNGGSSLLSWQHLSGSTLLDLTVPTIPKAVVDGVYAVTVNVFPSAMTVGGTYTLLLDLDQTGEDAQSLASSPPSVAGNQFPELSLTLVYHIPAGGAVNLTVFNNDGAAAIDFQISQASVVKLA